MRAIALSAVLVATLLSGGTTAALAAETSDTYAPDTPEGASLSGTAVMPSCEADAPWIRYSIVLDDPDNVATSHTAVLMMSNGTESTTVPLGEVVDGHLDGRVLWPGATVDANGRGNGWPGWTFENNAWAPTSGNFAWTRGDISAYVEVNPGMRVALSYPASSPDCLTAPAGMTSAAGTSLPATGGDTAALIPLAAAAGALVVGGGALLLTRRARRARD